MPTVIPLFSLSSTFLLLKFQLSAFITFCVMPRILLLTAGFGEGHNTAARCIAEALREQPGVEASVVDVYLETVPRFTKVLQSGYCLAIQQISVYLERQFFRCSTSQEPWRKASPLPAILEKL